MPMITVGHPTIEQMLEARLRVRYPLAFAVLDALARAERDADTAIAYTLGVAAIRLAPPITPAQLARMESRFERALEECRQRAFRVDFPMTIPEPA